MCIIIYRWWKVNDIFFSKNVVFFKMEFLYFYVDGIFEGFYIKVNDIILLIIYMIEFRILLKL